MAWNDFQREPNWQMPQLHSPGPGVALQALIAERQRGGTGQQIADTIAKQAPELMKAYRAYRADQVAQTFLDQASNYDSDNPTDAQKLARMVNDQPGSASDAWGMYQKSQADSLANQLKQAETDRYTAAAGALSQRGQSPTVDPATGLIWNGRQWVHPIGGAGASGQYNNLLNRNGLNQGDISGVDTTLPGDQGGVQYYPQGTDLSQDDDTLNKLSVSSQVAAQNPAKYVAYGGGLDKPVAVSQWQQILARSSAPTPTPQSQPQAQAASSPQSATVAIAQAKDAVSQGADPVAVAQRLKSMGIDPSQAGLPSQ